MSKRVLLNAIAQGNLSSIKAMSNHTSWNAKLSCCRLIAGGKLRPQRMAVDGNGRIDFQQTTFPAHPNF